MDKGQHQPPAYEGQPHQAPYQSQPMPPASGAQYPPQPPYQPYPMHSNQPQVVVTQPAVFDRHPVTMVCPHCRANITTAVDLRSGLAPWLICGGLVLVGCIFGCCIIPFCIDDLKDAVHRCPSCGQVVGQRKVIS